MAKMFYTLEEAAAKLGMSADDVKGLGDNGQLQEFRDRDSLMFKVDQVDLLAGDAGSGGEGDDITLAESNEFEPISLSSSASASALGLEDSKESTGVSIFEPDDSGSAADANADTLVTAGLNPAEFAMDASGSGSGLAQLTLEPDDTSLGGNLLEDLNASSSESAIGEVPAAAIAQAAGAGLFEGGSGTPEMATAAPAMMAMQESYDGAWSGLAAGMALAMIVTVGAALAVMILGLTGGAASLLAGVNSQTILITLGGGGGILLIFAALGWMMLRKS